MYYDPCFVYYTVMTGSEDQRLDLSIWTDIHTYIYFAGLFTNVFNVLNANPRYNQHMHQLMNFDFLEYD